eukprot:scaffold776_cov347-Pavlova_lutheri.AAC.44
MMYAFARRTATPSLRGKEDHPTIANNRDSHDNVGRAKIHHDDMTEEGRRVDTPSLLLVSFLSLALAIGALFYWMKRQKWCFDRHVSVSMKLVNSRKPLPRVSQRPNTDV